MNGDLLPRRCSPRRQSARRSSPGPGLAGLLARSLPAPGSFRGSAAMRQGMSRALPAASLLAPAQGLGVVLALSACRGGIAPPQRDWRPGKPASWQVLGRRSPSDRHRGQNAAATLAVVHHRQPARVPARWVGGAGSGRHVAVRLRRCRSISPGRRRLVTEGLHQALGHAISSRRLGEPQRSSRACCCRPRRAAESARRSPVDRAADLVDESTG